MSKYRKIHYPKCPYCGYEVEEKIHSYNVSIMMEKLIRAIIGIVHIVERRLRGSKNESIN